jgi:hypothetical protein
MFNDGFCSDNGFSVVTSEICLRAALCVLGCSKFVIKNFVDKCLKITREIPYRQTTYICCRRKYFDFHPAVLYGR